MYIIITDGNVISCIIYLVVADAYIPQALYSLASQAICDRVIVDRLCQIALCNIGRRSQCYTCFRV